MFCSLKEHFPPTQFFLAISRFTRKVVTLPTPIFPTSPTPPTNSQLLTDSGYQEANQQQQQQQQQQ